MSATPLPASPFRDEDRPRAPVHPAAVTSAAGQHGQAALVGIHAHLDRALVEMITAEAAALPRVQAAAERLSAGLLDHLAYEEAELLPALGRLGVPV